jgi:hypothetical protein
LCEKIKKLEGASPLQQPTLETSSDLILSTGHPVKKVQENDEVEALAREIYSTHCQSMSPKQSFELAEGFIQTRNERRGKNGK